jgi:GNAT superfamily N-acetyltransferase
VGEEDVTAGELSYRPMQLTDVGAVPIDHQGSPEEVRARIEELGSCALLVLDGAQHVGQLGFRRYRPGLRSPHGLMDPLYWGDFTGIAVPELPDRTLNLFCYHVGQLDDGPERDARYQGRGIGLRLLDELLAWAARAGFEAVVAKAVPAHRAVAVFMGGHPPAAYEERGFEVVTRWIDAELRDAVRERVADGTDLDAAAEVALCVRRF